MKTAAAYIRVSTEDQTEYSPASQLEKIREYAKRNGYLLPEEFIYTDEGISGRHTANRTGFNKMIGIAKSKPKPFDAILLWKFSRFARNREDSIVYKSILRKQCGIDVISISENIGDDKMSVLIEALIEAMDEYYSINLSEEVRRGMNEKARRGQAVTVPSYGYDIKNGKYIINPETAPVIRKIFSDFANGKDMRRIAEELNICGYRTRRGNQFENRTVRYILGNPVYIGKIRWTPDCKAACNGCKPEKIIIDGEHEAIIDSDVWGKVQNRLNTASKVKYMHTASPKVPFMLRGLVRCGSCGATLTRSAAHTSLQCYSYSHGKCRDSHSISIKKINSSVLDMIDMAGLNVSLNLNDKPRVCLEKSADSSAMLERERKKIERIKDAYENGSYTLDEFTKSKNRILSRITELKNLQKKCTSAENNKKKLLNRHINLSDILLSEKITEDIKNNLLKSFIVRIIFYRESGGIEIYLDV